MVTMKASDVRQNFADTLSRVAYGGERIVLHRNKKPVAVIISVEDMNILRAIEDRIDLVAARAALKEAEVEGSASWDAFMEELEL